MHKGKGAVAKWSEALLVSEIIERQYITGSPSPWPTRQKYLVGKGFYCADKTVMRTEKRFLVVKIIVRHSS